MTKDSILKDLASKLPVHPNARKRQLWLVCFGIGILSLAFLFMNDPRRAWGAYAVNTLYWLGIANGAIVLACAIRLSNGRWAGPIERIAESISSYQPYGLGAMAVLLLGGIWTYLPWIHHVSPRQAPFLNVPFLYIRTAVLLGLMRWLTWDFVRVSMRTDAHLLKDHVDPSLRPAYEKLSQGWRGDQAEAVWQRDRLAMRAPQIVLVFAVASTVLAWDFIMALTPEWTSTLFGWWFFMGAFLSGIAMTAFLATQVQRKYRLEAYITSKHFWDAGKLIFAFSIFWVYEFWAQYLPIWYANLPEETGWVFLRFEAPWRTLAFTVFTFIFLLPFLGLMNMYTKKNPFWLAFFSLIVLSGLWMERHLLVMPSLNPDVRWVGLPEVGVSIGFLGLFGWAVQGYLSRFPSVKVTDALVEEGGHGH